MIYITRFILLTLIELIYANIDIDYTDELEACLEPYDIGFKVKESEKENFKKLLLKLKKEVTNERAIVIIDNYLRKVESEGI